MLGEWRYSSTHSLTSALDGGEWSASCPGCFTHSKRAPGTHCIGGWVGPRASLDMVVKRKIPSPQWEMNPRTPIFQPIAQCYIDWAVVVWFVTLCSDVIHLQSEDGGSMVLWNIASYHITTWYYNPEDHKLNLGTRHIVVQSFNFLPSTGLQKVRFSHIYT